MFLFIAVLFVNSCLAGPLPATPENITVTFLTPTAVRVSWQTQIDLRAHPIDKYIVTYKPTDDRVVQDVAGSSEAIVLDRLLPSTQYSLAVTAIWMGKKYRSQGQIKFRTMDLPKNTSQQDFPPGIYGNGRNGSAGNGSSFGDDVTSTATNTLTHSTTRELPTIRGVEIGIVLIVLMVWAGAIALFFNRWGKIRMLLPYQPDYKHEQLKVPGTGVCTASGCNGQHSHQCLPRCEGCGIFDRCFQYPRRELERDCGSAVSHSHSHNHSHDTPTNTYMRGPSVDNQSIVNANVLEHVDSIDSAVLDRDDVEDRANACQQAEDEQLLQREPAMVLAALPAPPQRMLPLSVNSQAKQRRFAQQRSILKNSQERTFVEENEVLEAKKQLILRRRRLFSHYRQYDQWRRRQFSYDPSYFRQPPIPPRALAYADYGAPAAGTTGVGINIDGVGSTSQFAAGNVGRRRRHYRRQYSCADRSRDGSRESRGSSPLQLQKYHSMVASDTIRTESSMLNPSNYSEPASHIHMLAEEHSTSISERCTRSRINSAIFVSSEGRGFDSIEFLRRHGSQSVLCRKAKSAENITENGRRKSLRPWRTDDDSVQEQHQQQNSSQDIELKECGMNAGELRTLPVLHDAKHSPTAVTSLLARSSAITTANVIVGSISLEAPPPYIQDDDAHSTSALIHSDVSAIVHDSQDSAETVEEMVNVPLLGSATATASVSLTSTPSMAIEAKPRVLVHQRSSTASSSPHSSPKNLGLGLKIIKPKISAVPMVSVSGPSPPIEKPPFAECL
ncbi:GH21562 [Drosophila grimshawi]|uniref:GH21562 n=1 Tax=Drosophila grimshawi TaxID=7222 RepID=B4J4H2_DROGR|nr:GH21562 [Drosophila grimshawi]